jgi:7-keto-8-aminopelargonate synthetase-like enzyme
LSRATLHRFAHNDTEHLERILKKLPSNAERVVVTESVFSMDGDLAPLQRIAELCSEYNVGLMVDEAHACGVFGDKGAGLVNSLGLTDQVDIVIGTLSKALGSFGGFIACSESIRNLLVSRARSLIFSTAPPPSVMGAALGALEYLDENPDAGKELLERASYLRGRLAGHGIETGNSDSQIVPVIIGGNDRVLAVADYLRSRNIVVAAIRAPTVPVGTERIRLSVTLAHEKPDLDYVAQTIADAVKRVIPV